MGVGRMILYIYPDSFFFFSFRYLVFNRQVITMDVLGKR